MIHAYDETYLEQARTMLGTMLDFAVHDLKYNIQDFYTLFCESKFAKAFETGSSALIAGKSGVELAYDIVGNSNTEPKFAMNRSPEYWTGWALAYYQWYTALSFEQINAFISIKDIVKMYPKYHEMDIMQFVDSLDCLYAQKNPDSNLKIRRIAAGLTQSQLAKYSKVPLRTIQQYEQRRKNINIAKADTVAALAQALSCKIKDLFEITL